MGRLLKVQPRHARRAYATSAPLQKRMRVIADIKQHRYETDRLQTTRHFASHLEVPDCLFVFCCFC